MGVIYDAIAGAGLFEWQGDPDPRLGRPSRILFGGRDVLNQIKAAITLQLNAPDDLGFTFPSVLAGLGTLSGSTFTISTNPVDLVLSFDRVFKFEIIVKTRLAALAARTHVLNLINDDKFIFTRFPDRVGATFQVLPNGDQVMMDAFGRYTRLEYVGGYQVNHRSFVNHRNSSLYCNISRPLCTDNNGDTSWGTVDYSPGALTYTLNSAFMTNGALPIRIS